MEDTAIQTPLFDTTGKEYNINWVDEEQKLFIPNNPLHWKAHKLQLLIQRLDNQSKNYPTQFNSKNYIEILNEYERLCFAIQDHENGLDKRRMDQNRESTAAPEVGAATSDSLDSGISPDNPFAG